MIQTIASLFVVYAMNNGQNLQPQFNMVELPQTTMPLYTGAFGQVCPIPAPDAICLNTSPSFAGHAIETYPGFTKCERTGDCCGCALISCGNSLAGCNTLSVGDYGVYGVQNIIVLGRSEELGGGTIHCFGILGCANSVISASNIKHIEGSRSGSLKNATVTVNKPVGGFHLDCIATGSCENANIELKIAAPPAGMKCDPDYVAAKIELSSISCYGQDSCKNMHFIINNMGCGRIEIQRIGCYTHNACVGATFSFLGDVTVKSCHLIAQSDGIPQGLSSKCGVGEGPYTLGEYVHVAYPAPSPQLIGANGVSGRAGPPYYYRPTIRYA
eukprot:397914_1